MDKKVGQHISNQTGDTIVETKTCRQCKNTFSITDQDRAFYEKISPIFSGKKYSIPSPTFCPDCRQQRRLSFRNERNLYKRNCDFGGNTIVSMYSPVSPYKVYDQKIRWSDQRDPKQRGRDRKVDESFFAQFDALLQEVPRVSIINKNSENSEYTNISAYNKNCYLLVESSNNEDCYYGYWLQQCKDCCDCSFAHECERCYVCDNCKNCHNLAYSTNCTDCNTSYYLDNCIQVENCFMCTNTVNKQYCILNIQYTKEEYLSKVESLLAQGPKMCAEIYKGILKTTIKKYGNITLSEECSGDYIVLSKHCTNCYDAHDAEDCKYAIHVRRNSKSVMDADTVGMNSQLTYECINTAIESSNNIFCNRCWTVTENIYCNDCDNSSNLFGCIGLRNTSYCILNKQYTKEEYEILVPQIIEKMKTDSEWGEFFPSHISPFGYNETVANEYFPLTKDEALKKGFKRSSYEAPFPQVERSLQANELPNIQEVTDDILQQAIICEVSKKPFRIIKSELAFYRNHNLPLPTKHPDVRHAERMALRNPRKLRDRKCAKCGIDIKTSYSPERSEIVYCEQCYNKEIY